MDQNKLLIFLDSNILIEGFLFPLHPASAVAILASNKHIDLVTCSLVVEDIEEEILERAAKNNDYELIQTWNQFLERIRLRKMPDPSTELVQDTYNKYLGIMRHQADIPVLASAIQIGPDLILSDNTEHFNSRVSERCGITIWSCVEFLTNLVAGTIKREANGKKIGLLN